MPSVISCINLKGGVGKTALATNLAAFIGSRGTSTLLIDLDPQTNATFSCISPEEWQEHTKENGSVADLLGARSHTSAEGAKRKPEEVIVEEVFPGVDLLPSHLDLFTVDLDLGAATARETKLRRSLHGDFLEKYEYVVCDCPPNLTIPTQNAIALSTHYVVPISPDFLSAIGVALLTSRVDKFCTDLEHEIQCAGIVISRIGRRSNFRDRIIESLRTQFEELVLDPVLKERSKVAEAAESREPIFSLPGAADAADEFRDVCTEILERIEAE